MTLERALHGKEIKPVSLKGNQPWIFTGRTDAESEAPILWPPDAKKQVIGKDPDAGKDWRLEEKQARENKMVRWHHWLNRHEFEQTLGDSEGQGSLACCSLWDHKESDMTEWLNNNNKFLLFIYLRIIALQCCVRLCCTMKWISCEHTYILSLVDLPCCPSHPSRSSQSQYSVSETLHIIYVVCMSCLWVLGVFCCCCYCCWKSTVMCFLIPLF